MVLGVTWRCTSIFGPRQDYTVKQGNHNCEDWNDLMTGNDRKAIPSHVWANTSRSQRVDCLCILHTCM